ncbi:MAG: type 4a pilus biogenesis protein PilO [Bdellovibrionaceae bacterium]|jgi:Tfp pilus assembly protein PilO|nr:type 4a pilus biogenesis protein PilO [Pseudobdellovibrionaceae bacterium]
MRKVIEKLLALTISQIFLFGGALGGLYYYFIFDDGHVLEAEISAAASALEVEEVKKKETEIALKEEKRIKEIVGGLGTQFQEISKKLPNQLTSFDMNRQITVFSQASRAKIKAMTPQAPVHKEIVDEVPVRITIDDSTYGDIALFIYHASTSERLIRIQDFKIQLGTSREKGHLKFEGTVVGYRLNSEDAKKSEGAKQ